MEVRFSVIIPSYNRGDLIARAIRSVVNQTAPVGEILVVDDGSSDDTQGVVSAFTEVRYFAQPNSGVSAARNRGAELATEDWLIFLDSDDELTPEALAVFEKGILENPSAVVVRAQVQRVRSVVPVTAAEPSSGFLAASFCVKKEFFHRLGGYDTRLRFAENTELFHRIQLSQEVIFQMDCVVARYHLQDESGRTNLQNMTESILLILDKHKDSLSLHVKFLYYQILGVNYLRFRNFPEARKNFKAALSIRFKPATFGRWILSWMPSLSKLIYTPNF